MSLARSAWSAPSPSSVSVPIVRDTQDTAYVIFAVAVGMAVGAGHAGLAVSGLVVIAFAAFVMRKGVVAASVRHDPFLLNVRLALGHDPAALLAPVFDAYLVARHLVSIGTAKQGLAIELSYRAALRNEEAAAELVNALNRVDGVQSVSLARMDARID